MAKKHPLANVPGPRDFWMKTHIFQQGHRLVAICYMVAAGTPEIFRTSVDLRPIARAVRLYHKELHRRAKIEGCIGCQEKIAGFFGSIGKVIKKVGKAKLLKQVSRTAKTVIKSKVTGAVLLGTAAVFPPVGGPAVAAYAAANATLAAIENGDKIRKTIQGALKTKRKSKRVVVRAKLNVSLSARAATARQHRANARAREAARQRRFKAEREAAYARSRKRLALIRAETKRALAAKRAAAATAARAAKRRTVRAVAPSVRSALSARARAEQKLAFAYKHRALIKQRMNASAKAKRYLRGIVATSRYSPNMNKRIEAEKAARIYNAVATHRRNLQSIKQPVNPTPGLVVDAKGRITKGRFVQVSASQGAALQVMLAARGKVKPGYFRRVSGCIGCG